MDVSIIIVNYNTSNITAACIDSLIKQRGISLEIIVVDNASVDDSIQNFKRYGEKITLIANQDNLGFGKANNQAFLQTNGRYICLLNPDTELQNPEDLAFLIAYLNSRPECGLIGARLLSADGEPKMEYPGSNHIRHKFKNLPGKIAWVFGACMLIRREVFFKVKGFDEDFFLHGEDADLCLRIRRLGFAIGFCDQVALKHIGSASSAESAIYDRKTRKQKGLYVFYQKHYTLREARYIIRVKKMKSAFRMLTLKLSSILGDREKKNLKYERYRAIYDLSKHYLKNVLRQ